MRSARHRRGFSLLEVMIALAILVVCMVILVQGEATSAQMTKEAQKIILGTSLAQEKTTEVMLVAEKEGFTDQDHCEDGDFSNFAEDDKDVDFGDSLDGYHYEWCISQIDVSLAGDIAGMAQNLAGGGALKGSPLPKDQQDAASAGGMPPGLDLSAFGLGPEMISQMLSNYIREVRVRVWWGESSKSSEDDGDDVVIVTHIINPTGAITQMQTQAPGSE